jgi:hypothetical protein
MSWSMERTFTGSGQGRYLRAADVHLTAELAKAESMNTGGRDAAAAAWNAAVGLIEAGILGIPDRHYMVRLNGHVNPNHQPVKNYVNDYVSITISEMSPAV